MAGQRRHCLGARSAPRTQGLAAAGLCLWLWFWLWLAASAATADSETPAVAPSLPVPEGAERTARLDRAHDHYALPVAPAGGPGPMLERVEGRVLWEAFRLADAGQEASLEAIAAAYREALTADGFEILLDCADASCGGLDFRFGLTLLPPPAMLVDANHLSQITARGPEGAAVSVLASRVLGEIRLQIVRILPRPAPRVDLVAPAPAPAELPAPVLPRDDRELRDRLITDGHLRISGLDFETGSARLTRQSRPALARIARVLAADDALSVVIVGHSDNEGGLEANRDLSRRRAEAVRDALSELGVAGAQMSAEGMGFLAPLASNATAEGRAQNRRVELVLR